MRILVSERLSPWRKWTRSLGAALGCLTLLCLTAAPLTSRATQMLKADTSELTLRADVIALVEVLSVSAAWDAGHKRIITTARLQVAENWKGSRAGDELMVVQPGGVVGDLEMRVIGMPRFIAGQRAVVFLKALGGALHPAAPRRYRAVALSQGKRDLYFDEQTAEWMVAGGGQDALLLEPSRGGPFQNAAPELPRRLAVFRDQVIEVMKRAAKSPGKLELNRP